MRLGVNVDHIATVRQARRGTFPDPIEAALICQRAGADSIVCHLREDRRHIQDEDVRRLKRELSIPLNLEMSIAKEIVKVALDVKPSQVTLVPERRQELTTEGGLDVVRLEKRLRPLIKIFETNGIRVSLFVDPVRDQLRMSQDVGTSIVELHTGGYATATDTRGRERELAALQRAAVWGREAGLSVAAGHGLNYDNIRPIIEIPEIEEVNIGFSIISRALFSGLERAVRDMAELLKRKTGVDALHAA
jgi:pyridoxine 5-phosphate synthase